MIERSWFMNELLKRKQVATEFSDLYTPAYATELIVPYLKKFNKIWECASGQGHMTRVFEKHGLDVYESDITTGKDFLKFTSPPEGVDVIVTNPPYALKDRFLYHCYAIQLPFALLMPLTALGGKSRGLRYRKNGIELLIPDKRVNFIYEGAKKACWFHSAWFCHNVLPRQLIFKELKRE